MKLKDNQLRDVRLPKYGCFFGKVLKITSRCLKDYFQGGSNLGPWFAARLSHTGRCHSHQMSYTITITLASFLNYCHTLWMKIVAKEKITITLRKNNLIAGICCWVGAGIDGHAEHHAGQHHLWDEQRDLPYIWEVGQIFSNKQTIWIVDQLFSLLSFYIPMVIMVTTYALTIHHLRFISSFDLPSLHLNKGRVGKQIS